MKKNTDLNSVFKTNLISVLQYLDINADEIVEVRDAAHSADINPSILVYYRSLSQVKKENSKRRGFLDKLMNSTYENDYIFVKCVNDSDILRYILNTKLI